MGNRNITQIKKELREIAEKNKGLLNPRDIVEFAKNQNTALHGCFVWDDSAAAELYRIEQAHQIIRSIKVKIITDKKSDTVVKCREFVSITPDRKQDGGYRHINEVMSKEDLRVQFLNDVRREYESISEKLKIVSDIAYKKSLKVKEEIDREVIRATSVTPKKQRASA